MENKSKRDIAQYWGMGTSIGLCAGVGVVFGAIMHNLILWMIIGAGIGVVIGAISEANKKKK